MKEIYLVVERMEIVSGDKTFVTSKIFPCATEIHWYKRKPY